ncbi:hypothetical protein CA13_17570 [Planctomycetes bacterium CA13]|uniref:Uncharacterized protein n=1 Tax=Novipirellula herctigrandis TaxID=2527986 RepID=A0A5C5YZ72_9BACT|nr:hypothetical protein CA13_17570 [Planctomycetes bacterium CA13]
MEVLHVLHQLKTSNWALTMGLQSEKVNHIEKRIVFTRIATRVLAISFHKFPVVIQRMF